MKSVVEFFKSLVNWISSKITKEGIGHTVISILLVFVIIIFLSGYADRIIHGVSREVETVKEEQVVEHQDLWIQSRDLYGKVKSILRSERKKCGADYILFIEYHNGSENIATGYQFCKFDVSMSVRSDTVPAISLEDYIDENIYKWDILLCDKMTHQKMSSFDLQEIVDMDPSILRKLVPNEHTQYVVFYNIMHDNVCAGTLMFLYGSRDLVDYGAVATCGSDVETTIITAIRSRDKKEKLKKTKK